MLDQEIVTADDAMDFIAVQVAVGLAPVMKRTRFYRHSFSVSQFGSYIEYIDERGTIGRCQPKNLLSTFDFISLGLPVPGSFPDTEIVHPAAPAPERGFGVVTAIIPAQRKLSLLEAAEAALSVMPAGPERDNLEIAIVREGRAR